MYLWLCTFIALTSIISTTQQYEAEFQEFKIRFHKTYPSAELERAHFRCFSNSLSRLRSSSDTPDLTNYSDFCGGFRAEEKPVNVTRYHPKRVTAIPTSWDWGAKGAVVPPPNCGMCGGGCVATAITGQAAAVWQIAGHPLVKLSAEELVECASALGCSGGGEPGEDMQFIVKNGLASNSNYPYTSANGVTGTCNKKKVAQPVAKFSKYVKLPQNETALATFLYQHGPFFAGIDALPIQYYSGGIVTGKNCTHRQVDHAILVTGYGVEDGTKYWVLRNSWGQAWGEHGFIRIERGVNCLGVDKLCSALLVDK